MNKIWNELHYGKRVEKLRRKIKFLEREKEEYDKRLSKLLYPFGIFRIFKKDIRKEVLNLQKISRLLEMEIKDLYTRLNGEKMKVFRETWKDTKKQAK